MSCYREEIQVFRCHFSPGWRHANVWFNARPHATKAGVLTVHFHADYVPSNDYEIDEAQFFADVERRIKAWHAALAVHPNNPTNRKNLTNVTVQSDSVFARVRDN